jgi:4-amino-4-deoxy-L-arabinose transferase-like glycosyltransferase
VTTADKPDELARPELIRRRRVLVLCAAALALIPKLWMAATTFGTNDVLHWEGFAAGVRRAGPIGIYRLHFALPYNHPPLVGWMLVAMNHLGSLGLSLPFLIRAQSSLADVVTALLIFEMVRPARGLRAATAAGVLVAFSPVLLIISGFHGNTDPVFVMFAMLSAYLLVCPRWPGRPWLSPALAGASLGVAMSIKLVPVVMIPVLLLLAWRLGRRHLAAFVAGAGVVLVPLWTPVLLREWRPFRAHVLGYAGGPLHPWGITEFLASASVGPSVVSFLVGPGRFLILAVSALLPVALLLWRRDAVLPAVGLTLVLFFLLSPAWGTQYLSWPVAAAYLIDFRAATAYNLTAGALLADVYNRWSGGLPWNFAHAKALVPSEISLLAVVWTMLLLVAINGLRRVARPAGRTVAAQAVGQANSRPPAAQEAVTSPIQSAPASVEAAS